LVRRGRKADAAKGHFAKSFDYLCCPGLQNRTFVVPHRLVNVADPHSAWRETHRTASFARALLSPAGELGDRARGRRRRFKPRKGGMSPRSREVRDGTC